MKKSNFILLIFLLSLLLAIKTASAQKTAYYYSKEINIKKIIINSVALGYNISDSGESQNYNKKTHTNHLN